MSATRHPSDAIYGFYPSGNVVPLPLVKRQSAQAGIVSDRDHFYDVAAAPTGPLPSRASGDAPWTQAESSYKRMIACPFGIQNKDRGIVLLVPGTAGNASEVYKSVRLPYKVEFPSICSTVPSIFALKTIQSAYYADLPSQGFDVCWVDTPNYSISDMQLSAEFVAYAIKSLAPQSTKTGGKINIVSYSQGGPNVQWASSLLDFLDVFFKLAGQGDRN
ncbi:uncharacterized protein PGTG_22226 [Puccinia graminis f. sp. tritici CRL 75-36-700-3]|uniref:Uncharacterized protein n=1 Tax=Puccinia graminis f. sp. tritici (strain CRL 75-36-700-3 / race SCCL) TaxID=418459 RepID=H6QTY1_PUCGT|nr:uncharacterized protein PGTG_22226 [Puccinia graminis f. sp. tritici CRL 75-36-700-3]EHS64395.1 hypothetical protein PGTG_22226 [Puccinia graminis f. sp. tritici CRL 75-36-700-3]